jgi:hypothetical protein
MWQRTTFLAQTYSCELVCSYLITREIRDHRNRLLDLRLGRILARKIREERMLKGLGYTNG